MPVQVEDGWVTVGMGMLSWRSPATLARTLRSYAREAMMDVFDEALIFFQQISDADRAAAKRFGVACTGSVANLGIYGGVKALLESLSADYVLLLENDCPLIEPRAEVERQVRHAVADLAAGRAEVYRMRHREQPGEKTVRLAKYRRYYLPARGKEDGAVSLLERVAVRARAALRPFKARQLIGAAAYVEPEPERRHPGVFKQAGDGAYIVSSRHLNWTNQSILVGRRWMLDTVLPYVAAHPSSRTVNGVADIEKELNCAWWRRQEFRIGISRGLFTHRRVDR